MSTPYKQVIALHSNPRSGSTWLGQLLDSAPSVRFKYQPLKSRTFHGRINDSSRPEEVRRFFADLYHHEDDYLDQNIHKDQGIVPRFKVKEQNPDTLVFKHVRYHYLVPFFLEHFEEVKVIGIVRHPGAYLNSWRKAPKEFLAGWDFDEEWYFAPSYNRYRSGEYYGFNRWKEVASMFLRMRAWYPERFHLLRYEHLVAAPREKLGEVFEFCGLPLTSQTLRFLEESTHKTVQDDYSVYRGNKNVRDWENELPIAIQKQIENELQGSALEQFLHY